MGVQEVSVSVSIRHALSLRGLGLMCGTRLNGRMRRPSVMLKENSSQRAVRSASGAPTGGRAASRTCPPSRRLRTLLTLRRSTITR